MARALLYHTLLEYAEGYRQVDDLVIVTGQGATWGNGHNHPLTAATRAFLVGDCDPSLEVEPEELGKLVVEASSIERWRSNGAYILEQSAML